MLVEKSRSYKGEHQIIDIIRVVHCLTILRFKTTCGILVTSVHCQHLNDGSLSVRSDSVVLFHLLQHFDTTMKE